MSNLQVANTIREQLGAGRFAVMTGAKQFVGDADSLQFKLPAGAKHKINFVKITLEASDTYKMEFMNIRGLDVKPIHAEYGVYADKLQTVFTEQTGLYKKF